MPNIKINSIFAREIMDSRGNPTIEVEAVLNNRIKTKASVPSGASTGKHEALELRDNDPKRYGGKGALKAVDNVNNIIAKKLKGKELKDLEKFDKTLIELDGTSNKTKLGANAILGVSMAITRALALSENLPLYQFLRQKYFKAFKNNYAMPKCMMNVINGGAHANWSTDIQEYMIVPQAQSAKEKVRAGSEIFHALKNLLKEKGLAITVGDEGGFAPKAKSNREPLEWIQTAIKNAGYSFENVRIALDAASSEFYKNGKYDLKTNGQKLSSIQMIEMYKKLISEFHLLSIEDGLGEDDWDGWIKMTQELGKNILLVGDDIFVTNKKLLQKGIDNKVANTILIKLNQIGSVSETIETIRHAKDCGYETVISHRSGETNDYFISDLAVASGADYLKAGSVSRGERVAKYNRLMEIEEEIIEILN